MFYMEIFSDTKQLFGKIMQPQQFWRYNCRAINCPNNKQKHVFRKREKYFTLYFISFLSNFLRFHNDDSFFFVHHTSMLTSNKTKALLLLINKAKKVQILQNKQERIESSYSVLIGLKTTIKMCFTGGCARYMKNYSRCVNYPS